MPRSVTVVSNVKEGDRTIGILGDGEVVWHSDFSFKEKPTAARMLVAMEVPPRELGRQHALPELLRRLRRASAGAQAAHIGKDDQAGEHHRHRDEAAARRVTQ